MRILVVLSLLALTLAGCTDGAPEDGLDLRGKAETAAADLDPSADLMAIFTAEWTNASFGDEFTDGSQEAAALDQGTDDDVGDGKANAWAYLFRGQDDVLVILSSAGKVLHAGVLPSDDGFGQDYWADVPLGSAAVDSVAAAATLRAEAPGFASIIEQPDAVVVMALARDGDTDTPYWLFTAFRLEAEDEEDFFLGLVDADTGERVVTPGFGSG